MSGFVGIDLGTTYSALAYIDAFGRAKICLNAEGNATTPSVVSILPDHSTTIGEEAVEYQISNLEPTASLFKREMGRPDFVWEAHGRDYSATDLSAAFLTKMLDAAEAELGWRPTDAVVTVPAYFRDPERAATKAAAEQAGLRLIQTVNEPTAAAIAYGLKADASKGKVLVFDLGGGTFDVSVVELGDESKVLTSKGDHFLGGRDWDEQIVTEIAMLFEDEFGEALLETCESQGDLWHQAEITKKRLSGAEEAKVAVQAGGHHGVYQISRTRFEALTSDLVSRCMALTDIVLKTLNLKPSDIAEVLLVGGSTRMPMIKAALARKFTCKARAAVNPDEAVALGAAILAAQQQATPQKTGIAALFSTEARTQIAMAPEIVDVTNHSLGMIAVNEEGSAFENSIILPKDTRVPARQSRTYIHRFSDSHDEMEIFLTQGETSAVDDPVYLGRYGVSGLPSTPYGSPVKIEVEYAYDKSAIVSVAARIAGQSKWVATKKHPVPADVPGRFLAPPPPKIEPKPLSVYIFVDVSGSMTADPIRKAKAAASDFVKSMDLSNAAVGIGVVADKCKVLQLATKDPKKLAHAIDRIKVGVEDTGYANSAHPFDEIRSQLQKKSGLFSSDKSIRAAIVLADGQWSNQSGAVRAAKACHEDGIEIIGIGFGSADEKFLQDISSARDLSILTSEDGLSQAFATVAQVLNERSGVASGG